MLGGLESVSQVDLSESTTFLLPYLTGKARRCWCRNWANKQIPVIAIL